MLRIDRLLMKAAPPKIRSGQAEFERGVQRHRIAGFLCRRQYGKTTTASRVALLKMMKTAGHTVVFGSVKLDLGREIVRKESEALHKAISVVAQIVEKDSCKVVDGRSGKSAIDLPDDDWAELYEAQRLEFRLYHSRTIYSRTKVVALTPDAVGETGDLILDEVGRVKNFRSVWEAVKPIIASQPTFRCILTTTPPPDDSHYSWELLAPPLGVDFPVNPRGNWYRSELGVHILRVDAWDAAADGVPLYDDDTGAPISPEEARAKDPDKDAWDRNYGVKFVIGGTAAVGLLQLDAAQRRGVGRCRLFEIETEEDLGAALEWITATGRLGPGRIGLGLDLATTEKEASNPTSLSVLEEAGTELIYPAVLIWKTRDPATARHRIRSVIEAIKDARSGAGARRLAIDATSERYFATDLQRDLGGLLPVELVVASETVEQPGSEPITRKALLGNQYIAALDDNRVSLPPERYLKDDHRLVKRDRGSFTADIGPAGQHGDTFDGCKLGLHALTSTAGGIESVSGIHIGRSLIRRQLIPHRQLRRA